MLEHNHDGLEMLEHKHDGFGMLEHKHDGLGCLKHSHHDGLGCWYISIMIDWEYGAFFFFFEAPE